jgi:hypothetical protein
VEASVCKGTGMMNVPSTTEEVLNEEMNILRATWDF